MTDPKPPIDWGAIELEYRAGLKVVRLIAEQYGVSHVAILKRAKKEEWERDLTKKIQAREDAIVVKALLVEQLPKPVTKGEKEPVTKTKPVISPVSEKRFVEVAANTKAAIRLKQAARFEREFAFVDGMLGELEVMGNPEGVGLIESLMDVLKEPEGEETEDQRRLRRKRQQDAVDKITSLDSRVDAGKKIIEMTRELSKLQREAYGITGVESGHDDPESVSRWTDADRASRAASLIATAMARMNAAKAAEPAAAAPAHAP